MHIAYIVCLVVEALLAFLLIMLVLLHTPKGEGMGGIGGTATLFSGKRTAEVGLDRLTWIVSILFLIICAILGFGIIRS